jgi:glyoxylase-like metal-dependent hydrolase (beta-lactamase superfamily II)
MSAGPRRSDLASRRAGLTQTGGDRGPDQLISERTSLVVGDTELVLIPVSGGETPGALMVHLPAAGLLFAGDIMMPYLGAPLTAHGAPEGLLKHCGTSARPHPGSSSRVTPR